MRYVFAFFVGIALIGIRLELDRIQSKLDTINAKLSRIEFSTANLRVEP